MTKTKWCVIQKTKTKTQSEFAVKINTESLITNHFILLNLVGPVIFLSSNSVLGTLFSSKNSL